MLNAKMTLTWPNGETVTATLQAASAEANYPVQYTGNTAALQDLPAEADVAFLAFILRSNAARIRIAYAEEFTGRYDRQAGGSEGF
jgi:hypothetical protein